MGFKDLLRKIGDKIDKLFLITPSCYGTIAGGLISIITTLFIDIIPAQGKSINRVFMILAIVYLSISAGFIIYLSNFLEDLWEKHPKEELIEKVNNDKPGIRRFMPFLYSLIGLLGSLIFLFYAIEG